MSITLTPLVATFAGLLVAAFALPLAVHAALWFWRLRRGGRKVNDFWSAGVLPAADADDQAAVYIMAARSAYARGAVSVHLWLVMKRAGEARYTRYEVLADGCPLKKNFKGMPADARWAGNQPHIHFAARGNVAAAMIPQIEAAIDTYAHLGEGDYALWPGPNCASFMAHVVRSVPQMDIALPSNAVGRDFPYDGRWFVPARNGRAMRISFWGLSGIVIGGREGFEMNFMTIVVGFDPATATLKLPAFGDVPLPVGRRRLPSVPPVEPGR